MAQKWARIGFLALPVGFELVSLSARVRLDKSQQHIPEIRQTSRPTDQALGLSRSNQNHQTMKKMVN